jgi:hypothetical protein
LSVQGESAEWGRKQNRSRVALTVAGPSAWGRGMREVFALCGVPGRVERGAGRERVDFHEVFVRNNEPMCMRICITHEYHDRHDEHDVMRGQRTARLIACHDSVDSACGWVPMVDQAHNRPSTPPDPSAFASSMAHASNPLPARRRPPRRN